MCAFTVMMTHNTLTIQGNGCSKGIKVDPCTSKTKSSACLGVEALFLHVSRSLLPRVLFNKGSSTDRGAEGERRKERKEREMRKEEGKKCC